MVDHARRSAMPYGWDSKGSNLAFLAVTYSQDPGLDRMVVEATSRCIHLLVTFAVEDIDLDKHRTGVAAYRYIDPVVPVLAPTSSSEVNDRARHLRTRTIVGRGLACHWFANRGLWQGGRRVDRWILWRVDFVRRLTT